MGQASRLSMMGKPAPDPDPGMPVPPAFSFPCAGIASGYALAMTPSGDSPSRPITERIHAGARAFFRWRTPSAEIAVSLSVSPAASVPFHAGG